MMLIAAAFAVAISYQRRRDFSQPAARASASLQNHRSPLAMLMIVRS
jgi:hypothetical protein